MPLIVPSLDDRNFDDLFAEVRARVPVHTPEWTNLGDSDPGTTLLQLFAFLADNLSYRSNRIPEATRRTFLTLLGMSLRQATPATGFVQLAVEQATATVPAGAVVRAGKVEFRTRRTVNAVPLDAHVFWKRPRADLDPETLEHLRRLHEPFLGSGTTQLEFYDAVELTPPATGVEPPAIDLADPTSGPVDGALWVALAASPMAVKAAGNDPAAAVEGLRPIVAGQTLTLGLSPGATVDGEVLEPRRVTTGPLDPGLVIEAAGPGSAPTYQRLVVTHADAVLDRPGLVEAQLPALDRLVGPWDTDPSSEGTSDLPPLVQDRALAARIVTWLRVRRRSTGTAASGPGGAPVAWLGANVAAVVQAVRVEQERLGVGSGAPDQRFQVAHNPVLVGDPERAPLVEVQDAAGAWGEWSLTDALYAAGPEERVWAIDPEAAVISFGSGLHGMRPPQQAIIRITYEYGGGPQGMVPIGAINKINPPHDAVVKVTNPLATVGGSAAETVAEGERAIPGWLRHRDRAVTGGDFRDIVMRTPGVDLGRIDVLSLFDPRAGSTVADPTDAAGVVTIMVVPRADAMAAAPPTTIDPHVIDAVCAWVDPRRLITTRVVVRGATWVPVVVSIGIEPMPGEVREQVAQRVRTVVSEYLSPLTGGLTDHTAGGITVEATGVSPTGWPLGVGVRTDDIGAAATRVTGVRYVQGVRLAATRAAATVSDVSEVSMTGLELPFATVHVTVGPPEDPMDLLGSSIDAPAMVPIPVVPRRC